MEKGLFARYFSKNPKPKEEASDMIPDSAPKYGDDEPDWKNPGNGEISDEHYAPPPIHPEDMPFDPKLQEEWERKHRGDGDDAPRGSEEVDYSFDSKKPKNKESI